MKSPLRLSAALLVALLSSFVAAADNPAREKVLAETLRPYEGQSIKGVDTSTLAGKVVCGYQGWFNAEGDGAERGYAHWTKKRGPLNAESVKVDIWPDMSEYELEERFPTELKDEKGRIAEIFSSFRADTVARHFRWMREYGIDAAFVQRFPTDLRDPRALRHANTVLTNCRESANLTGRGYVVMYDLTGMKSARIDEVIEDWRQLRQRMKMTEDPAYLRHRGKPLVVVWGVGFSDKREYTLEDCAKLIRFLKDDKESGGCTVMLGVPTYWRELKADAVADPELHKVIQLADIVSPWSVGRYQNPKQAASHGEKRVAPDIAWCTERKLEYIPVAFPGFSWTHMHGGPLNAIPRLKGEFFWSQVGAVKKAGANMLYVAMFDEVDEATAIFKCTNEPPAGVGDGFVTYEGLPSDFYLKLTGAAGKVMRGEVPFDPAVPSQMAEQRK